MTEKPRPPSSDSSHLKIQVYTSAMSERVGLFSGLRAAIRVFLDHRWQLGVQFSRTVRGRFARSYLGLFWALLLPVVPVSAYLFLRLLFAPAANDGMHSAVYVGVGVSAWFLMSGALMAPMQTLGRHAGMLSRSHFPVTVAIAGELLETLFDTLVRVVFLIPFLLWLAEPGWQGALLAVFAALLMFMFAAGLGFFCMLLSLAVPDARTIIEVFMRYIIFLSLAIFPLPANVWGEALSAFNPFAVLIDNVRSLLVHSTLSMPVPFTVVAVLAVVLFFTGIYFVHVSERHVRGQL